jgi:hypothetical protein
MEALVMEVPQRPNHNGGQMTEEQRKALESMPNIVGTAGSNAQNRSMLHLLGWYDAHYKTIRKALLRADQQGDVAGLVKHLKDAIDILDEVYLAEQNAAGQAFLKVKLRRYKEALSTYQNSVKTGEGETRAKQPPADLCSATGTYKSECWCEKCMGKIPNQTTLDAIEEACEMMTVELKYAIDYFENQYVWDTANGNDTHLSFLLAAAKETLQLKK